MSKAETARLAEHLSAAGAYLEFGAGGSTLMAVEAGVSCDSVEASARWIGGMVEHPAIAAAVEDKRLRFHFADIGRVTAWSMPHPRTPIAAWANYYLQVWDVIDATPDLVLVDGRFRPACLTCALMAAPDALVLMHDYDLNIPNRQGYERVTEVADLVEQTGMLAGFRRRADFSVSKALGLLNRVRDDPW